MKKIKKMTWIIDDLAEQNALKDAQIFDLNLKLNRVIREYGESISEEHRKAEKIEKLNRIIDRHYFQMGIKKDNEIDITKELKRLYPRFIDKIKLFWSIIK